jgi:4-hydroxythreonine-4-phosphate dehydrogenase
VDCAKRGQSIVLAATGAVPVASTRELVHRMAAAADPLIRQASALMLTGGDTARAVLDRLGIQRLQVLGELEPGICLSRSGASAPAIVTKAGGFGDGHSLVRVLRHFRPAPPTNESSERKE